MAAPTGRAAKRLSGATEREAKTLHRLLEFKPHEMSFFRDEDNPIECDWLIVDETSMVDLQMMHSLLRAIGDEARVLFIGDVDQLPSVGCGNVLKDIIDSGVVPVSRLSQIYRQAGGSLITANAHRVNRGEFPTLLPFYEQRDPAPGEEEPDFFYVQDDKPKSIADKIATLISIDLPRRYQISAKEDVQVITPMHRGEVGSVQLNCLLQETLNPKGRELSRGEVIFRQGDRVMQTRNNYDKEVFNGDIGTIEEIDLEEGELSVKFDNNIVDYTQGELFEIELAYAVTVHKAQGSEYPIIVMPICTQHYMMLQRNLLYTAITRGKMLVVLVGQSKAIGMALRNDQIIKRYSFLAGRLQDAFSPDNS